MNNLQVFNNPEFGNIRTITMDGEPWFVGKDVAEALGYKEPTKAAREKVDEEDKGVSKIDTPSGTQSMVVINESGLYSLILSSKLPNAKKFKHWVTSEVLPSIRKTGTYSMNTSTETDKLIIGEKIWIIKNILLNCLITWIMRGILNIYINLLKHLWLTIKRQPFHLLDSRKCQPILPIVHLLS